MRRYSAEALTPRNYAVFKPFFIVSFLLQSTDDAFLMLLDILWTI